MVKLLSGGAYREDDLPPPMSGLEPGFFFLTPDEIDAGLELEPGEAKRTIDRFLKLCKHRYQDVSDSKRRRSPIVPRLTRRGA